MKKILIIDDDKTVAFALVIKLKAVGYEVHVAYDAMIGVNTAVQQRPDLIVLDIAMPAGGGFSVAERLQNIASTCGTPIVFITAHKDPALKKRALELGAAAYFEKPYNVEELVAAIRQTLGQVEAE